MAGITETIINEFFDGTDYLRPALLSLALAMLTYFELKSLKDFPRRYKALVFLSAIGIMALLFNVFAWKLVWLYYVTGAVAIIPLVIGVVIYLINQNKLKQIIVKSNEQSRRFKEDAALKQLKSISPNSLTPKQKVKYNRYRLYVLVKLGSLRAADKILDEIGDGDSAKIGQAHYHFLKNIILFHQGNMVGAEEEIQKAEDTKNKDTEPLVQVEIALNHGVSYVTMQNYQAADDCFHRASTEYQRLKLKEPSLLFLIYYNYAFNKTRIGNTNASLAVVDEYKTLLNLKNHIDQVNYFNLYLEILRQTDAPRDQLNEIVQKFFTRFQNSKLPLENKVIFAGSMVRIIWSGRLDPEPSIKVLRDNLCILDKIPPMGRYRIFTDLFLLFADLQGAIRNRYTTLINATEEYHMAQAECDLNAYRNSLPEEAVYARCLCYKEMAAEQKRNSKSSKSTSNDYLLNAVSLFHENMLYIDEQLLRLDIADELCGAEHVDKNYKPIERVAFQEQLTLVENFLPNMAKHPSLAEFSLRLSFYYMLLDEYDKCIRYYEKFEEARLSLNHFSPWMHRYRMITAFSVRIIHCKRIIEKIMNSRDLQRCSKAAQDWFGTFPKHDGILDSMLLGKFIGYDTDVYPLKLKLWLDPEHKESPRAHVWLYFTELKLNADITFSQFTEEENSAQIFFNLDRHPFESNQSQTVYKDSRDSGIFFCGVLFRLFHKSELIPEQASLFDEISRLIDANTPKECPTMVELKQLFIDTMVAMPAVEYNDFDLATK